MATVSGLTKARMEAIEANCIVNGAVDLNGRLKLTTHGGTVIDAGNVNQSPVLSKTNTSDINITLTGAGTPALPWNLKADFNYSNAKLPGTAIDSGYVPLAHIPDQTMVGILDADYRGGRQATVYVDGTPINADWLTDYLPNRAREVTLVKTGETWSILGHNPGNVVELTLENGWTLYSEVQARVEFGDRALARRLSSGLVVLKGLIRKPGTIAANEVIFTLPEGFRPSRPLLISVDLNNSSSRGIQVYPDGRVMTRSGYPNGTYISLDEVSFFANGTATWQEVGTGGLTWGSSFEPFTTASDFGGPVEYYKDEFGFVWFQGMTTLKAAVTSDNTPIINLPVEYRSYRSQHFRTFGSDTFAVVGTETSALRWKTNSPTSSGSWISLTGFPITTSDAFGSNDWIEIQNFSNGWVNYGGAFTQGATLRRADGLAMSIGLIRNGQLSKVIFVPEMELWPENGRIILGGANSTGRTRVDIASIRDSYGDLMPGAFLVNAGSTVWVSLDGLHWHP